MYFFSSYLKYRWCMYACMYECVNKWMNRWMDLFDSLQQRVQIHQSHCLWSSMSVIITRTVLQLPSCHCAHFFRLVSFITSKCSNMPSVKKIPWNKIDNVWQILIKKGALGRVGNYISQHSCKTAPSPSCRAAFSPIHHGRGPSARSPAFHEPAANFKEFYNSYCVFFSAGCF